MAPGIAADMRPCAQGLRLRSCLSFEISIGDYFDGAKKGARCGLGCNNLCV